MKSNQYHLELVATAACTKRMMEEMKGMGQRSLKGSTRDFFLFKNWFSLKKEDQAAAFIGVDFIGMVQTNIKGFCKAMLKMLTNYWPGGLYIVLRSKTMAPWESTLVAIG